MSRVRDHKISGTRLLINNNGVWTYRESLVGLCESYACLTTGRIDVRTPGENIDVRLISLTDNDWFSAIRAFTWIFVETYTTWKGREGNA